MLLLDQMLLIGVFLLLHQVLLWIFISINHGADAWALEAIGHSAVLAYRSGASRPLSSTSRCCHGLRGRWTGLVTSLMLTVLGQGCDMCRLLHWVRISPGREEFLEVVLPTLLLGLLWLSLAGVLNEFQIDHIPRLWLGLESGR
jgi:hypothetical protein